ncbi:MAG: hypothetical protein AVDCRST_MAG80-964 [uncultured Rubrobacteraceae bacterium]|uniref:Uncharacterized protein n=1 Tax=uncultured Rubrobacteraceae bacterium TaxID=349277 RepID=A0A6J4QAW5_9ACTN|nr:MAG: hypothetical protein AVDCRST_MAG80-964 [uncultured Rubrobacteraceae bacterium]
MTSAGLLHLNPSPPTRWSPSSSDPRRSLLHLVPPGHGI